MSIRWERPSLNTKNQSTFVFEPSMTTTTLHLLPAIQQRKSIRTFSKQQITEEQIELLFEAARWAASSMNGQSWEYIYATNHDHVGFEKIVSCLLPFNQVWAKNAPLLIICTALKNHENGKPYKHAWHDAGLANAQLVLQATSMGMFAHIMGGVDYEATQIKLSIPETHDVVCCIAIGFQGDGSDLSEELKQRESAPRIRKSLEKVARKV